MHRFLVSTAAASVLLFVTLLYLSVPLPHSQMTAAPSTSHPSLPPRLRIESSVSHLLQSLLELGICASDVQDSALESSIGGVAQGLPGGLIGIKANQVVNRMKGLHDLKDTVRDVMIPLEVVAYVQPCTLSDSSSSTDEFRNFDP